MGLFGKIFFAIVIDIFLEIYVFIEIAERLGYAETAGLLILFSIAGYVITKRIKYAAFQNALSDFSKGKILNKNFIKSAAYFIAGVLFFIPGFITDCIAVLFLIPFLNYFLIYLIFKYFKNKLKGNFTYYYHNVHNEAEDGMDVFTTEAGEAEDPDADEKPHKTNLISLPFKKH
ncbi:MAG: FxsA family protein [Deltaproteobacteria bacterium]|nr:FxsA family protein [Deltaproteobacteria bacterium]